MSETPFLPQDIFDFLAKKTFGQDDVLKKVSVAVYKHINGLKAGNLLLIGSSGTGKTTIMNSLQKFYSAFQEFKRFRAMSIMNANMLAGEEQGEVNLERLFRNLENAVNATYGSYVTADKLQEYMENATVCIDEVDKISSRISGKVNVSGIGVQHALLTLLEGERVIYETTRDQKPVKLPVDTSKLLFICGGAFEGLHDQIMEEIEQHKEGRQLGTAIRLEADGSEHEVPAFVLKEQLKLADLFAYGMAPQFISRFKSIAVLEDLGINELKRILLTADDSPFRDSQKYFKSMGIDLQITKDALHLIAQHAVENTRIGARALNETFSRVVDFFEFDPVGSGKLQHVTDKDVLTIDREMVMLALA